MIYFIKNPYISLLKVFSVVLYDDSQFNVQTDINPHHLTGENHRCSEFIDFLLQNNSL